MKLQPPKAAHCPHDRGAAEGRSGVIRVGAGLPPGPGRVETLMAAEALQWCFRSHACPHGAQGLSPGERVPFSGQPAEGKSCRHSWVVRPLCRSSP